MEASVFKALLRFIYADSMPKMEEAREVGESRVEAMWLQHLLVAADRYDLQRLKSMCEERLAKHIDLRSVTTVLALAAQQHCSGLKEACLEFLNVQSATALQQVISTSDWEHMSMTHPRVLKQLIAKLTSKV
jgi:speckle-type POZ protein